MATLTGQTIASTYDALLKVTDNGPITSSLKLITDGLGNNTALSLSNVAASINGSLTATSFIKSGGTSTQYLMADGSVSTLTNPITGTGTTNTLPKFTGASALGNSNITDTGSLITLGSGTYIGGQLGIGTSSFGVHSLSLSLPLQNSATIYGLLANGEVQSTATNAVNYVGTISSTAAGSYTVPIIRHYIANGGTFGAGSTVSTQVGYDVNSTMIGATANYGFRGRLASATGAFNIYMDGTANNYIAGSLGIGSTAITGYNLFISKNITGATTSYGIRSRGIIQSDVTSIASYYDSTSETQATSFTLANLYHFRAQQATFGAGSTVTTQVGFIAANTLVGATNNYGFQGVISSSLNNYNLYNSGTAKNYMSGDLGIGSLAGYVSSGPILTTTLTNGGTGYVDGTYTDVLSALGTSNGTSALFTVVVSGGIVTSATLTWGGANYRVGDTLDISNTLLGGTGSGLVITVATVDSSQLKVSNINGGDITLNRVDSTTVANDNIGSIKFEHNDGSTKASGLQAKISAFGSSAAGYGAYLSFFTKAASTGATLVEGLRILPDANVFIPTTALGIGTSSLVGYAVRVTKTMGGTASPIGFSSEGTIQSDATSLPIYFRSISSTAAASFTTSTIIGYEAEQGTFGAGSVVTNQYGFRAKSTLVGATNNYGFIGQIPAQANTWNLYMSGTANNYMAGSLGIGTTSLAGYNLAVHKTITGATSAFTVSVQAAIQSDVTGSANIYFSQPGTQATTFTLPALRHFHASQGIIGAGSTLTDQMGFFASSTLIGGTNNYGFRGQVPSGTNRWNLYMDGAASNYLNGTTLIGSTTDNGSGAKLQVNGNVTFQNIFNRRTASYTLVLSDQNDIIEMNVASANNLTIPLNATVAFPIGTEIAVLQYGAGQTTIVATVGVTLRAKSNALKISGQYAGCTLVKVGTDEWYVIGDLTV
jgi:hypothetical protein